MEPRNKHCILKKYIFLLCFPWTLYTSNYHEQSFNRSLLDNLLIIEPPEETWTSSPPPSHPIKEEKEPTKICCFPWRFFSFKRYKKTEQKSISKSSLTFNSSDEEEDIVLSFA
jgi:hypothetical protein